MVRPKVVRSRLNAVLPLAGLTLWAACSSDNNDFFGSPLDKGTGGTTSGASGAGTGASTSGKGGASASGGTSGGTGVGGAGGTMSAGGSDPGKAGGSAGMAPTGGAGTGGKGGSSASGGSGNLGGTGAGASGGTDVTPTDGGAAGAGAGGESGGQAGDSGNSGAGGSMAGSGGTTAGTGGSSAGTGGSTAGTGGTSSPTPCGDDGACDSGEYCEKTSCNAASGTCQKRPASCAGADAAFAPVCGCDHMTYFSVCVAKHEGTNVAASGECTSNQATCTRAAGGSSCSPARDNAHCYRPRSSCSGGASASEGVCWVLPDPCPTEDKVNYFCNMTSGSGGGKCMGLCEILTAEDAVWRDSSMCN